MRLKSAVVALFLSLVSLTPRVTLADTLTLTGVGGANTDGVYIYPYLFTVTGPGGVATNLAMACLNFDREITFGETWTVNAVNVTDIGSSLDGELQASYRADAYLLNQFGTSAGTTSEIQFALWSIMDPSVINASNSSYNGPDAFDATSQLLASMAKVAAATLPTTYYTNDMVFVPDLGNTTGWTNGEPQIFMVDPPPSVTTPEPSSLLLLGTGLLGTVAILRRKFLKPSCIS